MKKVLSRAFVNMAVSYEIKYDDNNKCFYAAANWTSVDNAVYRVTENDEIASAPDNYKFTGHGVAGGQIKLAMSISSAPPRMASSVSKTLTAVVE